MQYYCFLRKIARSAFEKTKDDLLIFSAIIRNYRVIPFLNNLHPAPSGSLRSLRATLS
jgi:hypothetical protein